MTTVRIYRNKRNNHKFIEIHNDGHYHNSLKQFMKWDNGVKNYLGDGRLHRWRKGHLEVLLQEYEEVVQHDIQKKISA